MRKKAALAANCPLGMGDAVSLGQTCFASFDELEVLRRRGDEGIRCIASRTARLGYLGGQPAVQPQTKGELAEQRQPRIRRQPLVRRFDLEGRDCLYHIFHLPAPHDHPASVRFDADRLPESLKMPACQGICAVRIADFGKNDESHQGARPATTPRKTHGCCRQFFRSSRPTARMR